MLKFKRHLNSKNKFLFYLVFWLNTANQINVPLQSVPVLEVKEMTAVNIYHY